MPSAQTQILSMLADERIRVEEADRLLALVTTRDRLIALLIGFCVAGAIALGGLVQSHLGDSIFAMLHSGFHSLIGSEAFRNLHIFSVRILGELP